MLVIDQGRDAGDHAKAALDVIQPAPVVHHDALRQGDAVVARRLIGEDDGSLHAFSGQLARELRNPDGPVGMLPAGHRHGAVVEDLVGDAGARRDRLPDGEGARVEQGAVADILEEMRSPGEVRGTDPLRALRRPSG